MNIDKEFADTMKAIMDDHFPDVGMGGISADAAMGRLRQLVKQRIAELERQLKINAGYEETALADIRHLKAECERMQPVVDAAMAMYRGGAYTPFDRVVHAYLKGKG